ncbi:MAG: hypothetical protein PF485_00195 [Bacteroidales bacterium]|nr:hypothetical protein [Bacteroidales bacterium]
MKNLPFFKLFSSLPRGKPQGILLIKIEHQNQYSKVLKKFEQDQFSGDWETKSYGIATDCNLMTKGNATGEIEAIVLKNAKSININTKFNFYGFYIYTGEIKLFFNNKSIIFTKGSNVNYFVVIFCNKFRQLYP